LCEYVSEQYYEDIKQKDKIKKANADIRKVRKQSNDVNVRTASVRFIFHHPFKATLLIVILTVIIPTTLTIIIFIRFRLF
jgi:hypothetical protein